MISSSSSSSSRSRRRGVRSNRVRAHHAALAQEGQNISRVFNPSASRPMPTQVGLEQRITVSMNQLLPAFITSGATPQYYGSPFALNFFANYTEYTGLFDQYRFEQLEVWLTPSIVLINGLVGEIASAIDLDDGNTPTSLVTVNGKAGAMTTGCMAGQYHRWKPHIALAAYSSVFTSFSNRVADWIDAASPGVQHYGLKVATTATTGTSIPYDLNVRAIVSFRAPSL